MSESLRMPPPPYDDPDATEIRLACSYARKSDKNCDGIETQHEINRRAAARDGYHIPDYLLFDDDDTTGASISREGFDRMVAMIESGMAPFTRVYVRNKKRFGRWDDSGMHDYYRIHFEKHKVHLRYTEGANPDYSKGPTQDVVVQSFYDRIETIDASRERAETRKRVMTGVRRRIVKGFWPAPSVPYGTQRWLADLATGELLQVVNETDGVRQPGCGYKLRWRKDDTIHAIRLIFEWVQDELLGPAEIVNRLNEIGLPPAVRPGHRSPHGRRAVVRAPCEWTAAGVEYILRNRIYCGQLLWPKDARLEDAVPHSEADLNDETPILHTSFMPDAPITVEQFEAVQEIIANRRRRSTPQRPAIRPLLSGIVRCGECGRPWHGHRGRYYRHEVPGHSPESAECPHRNRYVRIEQLDSAVLDRVLPLLESEEFVRDLENLLDHYVESLRRQDGEEEIKELQSQRESLRQQIQRVIRNSAMTDDAELLQQHREVLESLKAELSSIDERVSTHAARIRSANEARRNRNTLVDASRRMLTVFRSVTTAEKRAIISGLIDTIRFHPETVEAEVLLKLQL